jgi:hypothetical protein
MAGDWRMSDLLPMLSRDFADLGMQLSPVGTGPRVLPGLGALVTLCIPPATSPWFVGSIAAPFLRCPTPLLPTRLTSPQMCEKYGMLIPKTLRRNASDMLRHAPIDPRRPLAQTIPPARILTDREGLGLAIQDYMGGAAVDLCESKKKLRAQQRRILRRCLSIKP